VAEDYCELCDLPLSTCVHGLPPEPPKPAPAPRAPRAPRTTTTGTTTRATTARTRAEPARPPRRRTAPEALAPVILDVLRDLGGEAEADDVLTEVEERYADRFLAQDHETGPQGELRWRTAARTARKALADEGLLVAPRPGLWSLTERGRRA
jgi:hypothetical protein